MKDKNRAERDLEVYKAILTLRTVDECVRFFDDLCSITERRAIEQRYQVAEPLSRGLIYSEIFERTGASSATISRVNRALRSGADGYALALERMAGESAE